MPGLSARLSTAAERGLAACHACGLLVRAPERAAACGCPRCGATIRARRAHALQRTSALLVAASICYVPANVLPVLVTTAVGKNYPDTILQGVLDLCRSGSWVIALIVLVASVMIPLGKIGTLAGLVWLAARGGSADRRQCTRLFRLVRFIGRWSILDVFVDAFVVGLLQFGPLLSARPGPGVAFFAATAVLTMLAAGTFDTRLLWDGEHAEHADVR